MSMVRTVTVAQVVWLETLRRKDVYVLLILLGTLLAGMVSLDVFGLSKSVGYIKDLGLLTAWAFSCILTIGAASRELPQEESRGTIFSLLAKPVKRREYIIGKWLGVWTVACVATLCFYLLLMLLVALLRGSFEIAVMLQGYTLHCAALAVITAISIMFSTLVTHDASISLSAIFVGAALLITPRVPELTVTTHGLAGDVLLFLYNMLPHFEVFDMRRRMIHGFGPVSGPVYLMVVCYGILLTALFILLAWLAYRSKRFSRDKQT